jgi:hypothetical protein
MLLRARRQLACRRELPVVASFDHVRSRASVAMRRSLVPPRGLRMQAVEGPVSPVGPGRLAGGVGGGVDVALRRVQRLVAEQRLDLGGGRAVLGEAGGERVAQGVDHGPGRDPVGEPGGPVGAFDEVAGAAPLEPVPPPVDEQGSLGGQFHPRESFPAALHVPVDDLVEGFFDGDGPFLAALAHDFDAPLAGPPVDGAEVETR